MRVTKFFKKLSKKAKVLSVAVVAVAVIAIPAVVYAGYGPNGGDRKIFDFSNPQEREGAFDGPRFNSYINTNVYGDERAFLDAKECVVNGAQCYSQGQSGGYADQQPVQPGKEYIIRTYVHNIANPSINASGKGVAQNTRVRLEIPDGTANGFTLQSRISADNAIPQMVYDTVSLQNNTQAFDVEYVPGSAYISNAAHPGGFQLSDSIVTSGAQIGYDQMNGVVPGCFEYSAYVTIRVKITAPKMEFQKRVTTPGSTEWKESITAKPGDTVSWLINFDAKDAPVDDVTVRDQIPAGLTLVPGSIMLFNPNNPNGVPIPDTGLGAGGANVGDYAAGSGGAIRFRTTVNGDVKDKEICEMKNVAYGRAENVPEKSDDAKVVIEDCEKPKVPKYTCDLLKVTKIGNLQYRFAVDYTAENGATLKSYTYDFGDGTTPLMTDKNPVEHTYAQPGEYAAKVTLVFDVNGEEKVVESNACKDLIKTDKPDNCPTPGKEHLPKDSPECAETPVTPGQPGELPSTGAGSLIGIFAATTAAGMIAYHLIWARRFNQ